MTIRKLTERIPSAVLTGTQSLGGEEILDIFLDWVSDTGIEPYPAQEEAFLEIFGDRHVILNTPTGSGKTLVALALQFRALCEGKRCFYTSPIKALASEKFFDLCEQLGPENVGMQTGDASINADAPILCCTAEILSNRSLRQGDELDAHYVVMDEFHYYGDPDRGVAWQIPLLTLPRSTFLLMSATLGNMAPISERLTKRTGRDVALVYSDDRPVPLDYEYRETPLHETVEHLLETGRAPIYIVNFTQRECAELAQSLTSINLCSKQERKEIRRAIGDFRWDTPYGKDVRRLLGFGAGIHHAGLLPKYRLLVEQLAQQGLLRVICGTDTLGVGVNIPIRTVLFTKLSKYDGKKISLLKVRDFKQIAGRAGRKGFDDRGSVVAQAPEHIIAQKKLLADPRRRKKAAKKKPPPGFVGWNRKTFESLIARPPEVLRSRFKITHGMVLDLLQHDDERDLPERDNFDSLRELIELSHEDPARKRKHLTYAALLVRSLHRAGIVKMRKDTKTSYWWVVVNDELQWDFSLLQALALYLVEAIDVLDPEDPDYALDLVSLVEAILENPRVLLYRQVDRLKGELIAKLKAEGVGYEERMEKLDEVTHPQPIRELIEQTFSIFRRAHPWVAGEDIHPKSIGRELFEGYFSFQGYVRHYGLQRSEGVLLRYLSQLFKTLSLTVPEKAKTEPLYEVLAFFRTMLEHTDSSLLEEWESLVHPELQQDSQARDQARQDLRAYELLHDPRAFRARIRAELHQLARCLSELDFAGAASAVRPAEGSEETWDKYRFERALQPFVDDYGPPVFNHDARSPSRTRIEKVEPRLWTVSQVLVDQDDDNLWYVEGQIDLRSPEAFEGPLLRLHHLGT